MKKSFLYVSETLNVLNIFFWNLNADPKKPVRFREMNRIINSSGNRENSCLFVEEHGSEPGKINYW